MRGEKRISDLTKSERYAIEALATRFSATWEKGNGSAENYLCFVGKRVAVETRTLKWRGRGGRDAGKPHLRFDKVVREVMSRLQATLAKTVPHGTTLLVTITAPIRLASKTTTEIEEKVRTLLKRESAGHDVKRTIHGNRVMIRILRHGSERPPKVIGFVHNPETDPRLLLDATGGMLKVVRDAASGRLTGPERWLVVTTGGGISWLEAYRYIYSLVHSKSRFEKIFVALGDGRVEELTE